VNGSVRSTHSKRQRLCSRGYHGRRPTGARDGLSGGDGMRQRRNSHLPRHPRGRPPCRGADAWSIRHSAERRVSGMSPVMDDLRRIPHAVGGTRARGNTLPAGRAWGRLSSSASPGNAIGPGVPAGLDVRRTDKDSRAFSAWEAPSPSQSRSWRGDQTKSVKVEKHNRPNRESQAQRTRATSLSPWQEEGMAMPKVTGRRRWYHTAGKS
jgi:hypothetical protein